MDWKNKLHRRAFALIGALVLVIAGCSIRYSPNGGALDYTQLKTITIGEVINKAPIVNPILASSFTEKIKDYYESRTRSPSSRRRVTSSFTARSRATT